MWPFAWIWRIAWASTKDNCWLWTVHTWSGSCVASKRGWNERQWLLEVVWYLTVSWMYRRGRKVVPVYVCCMAEWSFSNGFEEGKADEWELIFNDSPEFDDIEAYVDCETLEEIECVCKYWHISVIVNRCSGIRHPRPLATWTETYIHRASGARSDTRTIKSRNRGLGLGGELGKGRGRSGGAREANRTDEDRGGEPRLPDRPSTRTTATQHDDTHTQCTLHWNNNPPPLTQVQRSGEGCPQHPNQKTQHTPIHPITSLQHNTPQYITLYTQIRGRRTSTILVP